MSENKKERFSVRLSPELRERLREEKNRTGKTATAVIEEALCRYFEREEQEAFVDRLLVKFDDKYRDTLTRIQLAAGASDRNVQTLLNIKNTELFYNGLRPDSFMSMYETRHSVMSASEEAVRKQVAKNKQTKDNGRVDR